MCCIMVGNSLLYIVFMVLLYFVILGYYVLCVLGIKIYGLLYGGVGIIMYRIY